MEKVRVGGKNYRFLRTGYKSSLVTMQNIIGLGDGFKIPITAKRQMQQTPMGFIFIALISHGYKLNNHTVLLSNTLGIFFTS
jgi:hypothetical protein